MKNIFLFLALILLITSAQAATNWTTELVTDANGNVAIYNQSSVMSTTSATPWEIWFASGILGIIMFFMSLRPRSSTMELEVDAIISGVSTVPIGFCAWASFSGVDRITGSGVTTIGSQAIMMVYHTLYVFPIVGIIAGIFLIATVGNLIRILAQHKLFKIQSAESAAAVRVGPGQN